VAKERENQDRQIVAPSKRQHNRQGLNRIPSDQLAPASVLLLIYLDRWRGAPWKGLRFWHDRWAIRIHPGTLGAMKSAALKWETGGKPDHHRPRRRSQPRNSAPETTSRKSRDREHGGLLSEM